MKLLPLLSSAMLGMMVVTGAGCSRSAAPAPAGTNTNAAAPASPTASSADACNFAYFPLKTGYTASYQSSAGSHGSTYTINVSNASPGHATLSYHFGQVNVTNELSCSASGISQTSYLDLGSLMSGRASTRTNHVEGLLMPLDMHAGSTWTASYDVTTSIDMPNAPANMREVNVTVSVSRKALAEESVTVPAGTFTAMKVKSDYTITTHMPAIAGMPAGMNIPPIQFSSNEWWAKGKGLIKSEGASSNLGNWSTEATAISVP